MKKKLKDVLDWRTKRDGELMTAQIVAEATDQTYDYDVSLITTGDIVRASRMTSGERYTVGELVSVCDMGATRKVKGGGYLIMGRPPFAMRNQDAPVAELQDHKTPFVNPMTVRVGPLTNSLSYGVAASAEITGLGLAGATLSINPANFRIGLGVNIGSIIATDASITFDVSVSDDGLDFETANLIRVYDINVTLPNGLVLTVTGGIEVYAEPRTPGAWLSWSTRERFLRYPSTPAVLYPTNPVASRAFVAGGRVKLITSGTLRQGIHVASGSADLGTHNFSPTLGTLGLGRNVAVQAGKCWVGVAGALTTFDLPVGAGAVVATTSVAFGSGGVLAHVMADSDGVNLWISEAGYDGVKRYNTATLSTTAVAIPAAVSGGDLEQDTANVYLFRGDSIWIINKGSLAVTTYVIDALSGSASLGNPLARVGGALYAVSTRTGPTRRAIHRIDLSSMAVVASFEYSTNGANSRQLAADQYGVWVVGGTTIFLLNPVTLAQIQMLAVGATLGDLVLT